VKTKLPSGHVLFILGSHINDSRRKLNGIQDVESSTSFYFSCIISYLLFRMESWNVCIVALYPLWKGNLHQQPFPSFDLIADMNSTGTAASIWFI